MGKATDFPKVEYVVICPGGGIIWLRENGMHHAEQYIGVEGHRVFRITTKWEELNDDR